MKNANRIFVCGSEALRLGPSAVLILAAFTVGFTALASAQESMRGAENAAASIAPVVPQQVRYAGQLATRAGDTVEAVFRIYAGEQGGDPLWTETQRVSIAEDGSYSILLGGASVSGLPQRVFSGGAARWLGISIERGPEQERVLLSSVPYAMKSADAESLAGHAASDFVTHEELTQLAQSATQSSQQVIAVPAITPLTSGTVTGSGTAGTIPLWAGTLTQGNSEITQVGADVGINIATPGATLDVGGSENVEGILTLPAQEAATTSSGHRSQLLDFVDSAWSTTTKAPVVHTWRLYATEAGNNSSNPTSSFNFQFQNGAGASTPTVLSIAQTGVISFAPSQSFPGTITSVAATSPVTATTSSGAVSLGFNTAALETTLNSQYAQLGAPNTFTQTQTMSQGVTVQGEVSANLVNSTTGYQLGGVPFDSGSVESYNASLGFSSSPSETGSSNIGVGPGSLLSNAGGTGNIAVGAGALGANQSGSYNTAVGQSAFDKNASGSENTAIGFQAGEPGGVDGPSLAGDNDTYIGANTGPGTGNGSAISAISNATAIGANASVIESNALILGGVGGSAVSVGIGTASPYYDYALDVDASSNGTINGGVAVNSGGGNIYLGMTQGVHKFRVDTNGNVFGTQYLTSGADFAESFAVLGKRSRYEAGDLLVIDPSGTRRLALATTSYSKLVAGIYSTKPGMLASPHDIDDLLPQTTEVPLAVVGVVPCKATTANGPIKVGDLLVTSSRPGYAMKGTNLSRMLGAVVGKALEPLPKGAGVIQVLVTLQ